MSREDLKLCSDCNKCSCQSCHQEYRSVTDGKIIVSMPAKQARESELYCGAEARYFEGKDISSIKTYSFTEMLLYAMENQGTLFCEASNRIDKYSHDSFFWTFDDDVLCDRSGKEQEIHSHCFARTYVEFVDNQQQPEPKKIIVEAPNSIPEGTIETVDTESMFPELKSEQEKLSFTDMLAVLYLNPDKVFLREDGNSIDDHPECAVTRDGARYLDGDNQGTYFNTDDIELMWIEVK